ncbi:unnamed protein product [Symbiodinium natans]|uniref:Uncharacterized protein n=1 Tax=Symbiodinium natans TaxID=878477 RepID=A0A812NPE8_9DINO|nr:unnamed protein product [Symbiodinium natans]
MQMIFYLFVLQLLSGNCKTAFPSDGVLLKQTVADWVTGTPVERAAIEDEYGPIGEWDVSQVTTLNSLFKDLSTFNEDISSWNTSQVTDMTDTFRGAAAFNQALNSWDTSQVYNMQSTFRDAVAFNQPLNSWDTSRVENFVNMFRGATAFNQPLNSWDTSRATDMTLMFRLASTFNQPLDSWDTSLAESMARMFKEATAFSQCLANWDTSSITGSGILDMFESSGCPADATVLENGLLDCGCSKLECEKLVDYALLKKQGRKALKKCTILSSLIQDTEFTDSLSWRQVPATAPLLAIFVLMAFAAATSAAIAWRSNFRQRPFSFPSYEFEEL